jgi:hypothetical protein
MTTTKRTITPIVTNLGGVIRVPMPRDAVLALINNTFGHGVDLPTLVRDTTTSPWQISQLWVGFQILENSMISMLQSEVDVSDDPYVMKDVVTDPTPTPTPASSDGVLEVVL